LSVVSRLRARTKRNPEPSEPLCRGVRCEETDGIELAGLLYEPARTTQRAAIFLHGNGGASVFEAKRTNLLASELVSSGIAWFPFNNRGAHLLRRLRTSESARGKRRRTSRKPLQGGMAHELIRDCIHDIDGAVRELRRRGYREIHLVGHSTGANKVVVYDHYRQRNPIRSYVLLAGGDDTGLLYQQLGPARFAKALTRARERIRSRRGEDLVPPSIFPLPLSWRSFYDMANPNGDYNVFPFLEVMRGIRLSRRARFHHLRRVRKNTFVLYGDSDEYCYGDVSRCVAILADAVAARPNFELAILRDADHGFSGREEELGRLLVEWMEA
jgi:pimeloyl-ACP methyl ester carboxylesterase